MIQVIVAAHGKLAAELVNSSEMVFGEVEGLHGVTFVLGEGQDTLVEKYEAIIAECDPTDSVLFLVDLFGGSPYNAAARVAATRPQDDIVTGVSLPMLLEVLDAKDDAKSTEDLATTAKEVGVMAVKSYRKPDETFTQAEETTRESSEEQELEKDNTQYDPNGRMSVNLLRIDDRLIHGQVATSWAKAVKCEAIFAISDEVANDELRKELLLQIAPPHLKAYVISVDKAIKVYNNPKYASRNILMLVTKPEDAVRLIEGGLRIDTINVGGMTHKEGNKQLSDAVTVNPSNVEAFKKLLDMGVKLSLQKVAANKPVELTREKLDSIKF
ncbi:mannose/fructose/sorbose PTS transporter subunit IIA [Rodentibacter pneumotropicus]|uniref:mannose/fructose/sorbose PTS transporter subunit IIA n=1 Tax=Rodentibacter pneumotropicus TaxID=758 RepID=UPI00232EA014|nr:mannose/fructose/sorbose PTS transporter subunit IIA [Rodentibacter pneumotropicus]MDC2826118.1 mannose/fructose/sorbose PTS transporter subunit IIA [Rodentibacter pneumotropicus]